MQLEKRRQPVLNWDRNGRGESRGRIDTVKGQELDGAAHIG